MANRRDRTIEEKREELRALMSLTGSSTRGASLVINALIEATLKQQENVPLGAIEVHEASLLDFLDVLTEQTAIEVRAAARATTGERPAEPLFQAFEEIVRDEKVLLDPDQIGYVGAAVYADLTRENSGGFVINVALKDIDGAQLSFVLDVARRYELEAREEGRYLTLRPHLIAVDESDAEREPEESVA